jgi:two-component system chemotaxis response regulator CheB
LGLEPGFQPAILIVQHLASNYPSMLPELLSRRTGLTVKRAYDGEPITRSSISVAPPDEHLTATPGLLQLEHSDQVHFSRPSIDVLFKSVARSYGPRAVGLLLSGNGPDGAAGIRAIKAGGGVTIVQDPATAEFGSMARFALATGAVDYMVPVERLGAFVMRLSRGQVNDGEFRRLAK